MEKDRKTMVSIALIEDTPPTTSNDFTRSTSPIMRDDEESGRNISAGKRSESVDETGFNPITTAPPMVVDIMSLSVITDASVMDQTEKDPSRLLFIPVGSDGGMSELLGHEEKVVEPTTSETIMGEEDVIHREGKGLVVADDEQRIDDMEEIDENEGDMTPSGGDVVGARLPKRAMQRMPWKHELACLCKNLAETSILTGHVVQRAVKVESKRCTMISRLKEEKYCLECKNGDRGESDIGERKQRFERGNGKQKGVKKKSDEETVSLTSKLNGFRSEKLDLQESLELKSKEKVQMKTELDEARLALAQMKEKREMLEAHLPSQMEYAKMEDVREFKKSADFKKLVDRLIGPVLINGFRMGIAQVKEMLEDMN
ncbi:hypothetical protein Dimus_016108 [Dionaea muscipula]